MRDMLAELAEGEIEAQQSIKSAASIMCQEFDFIFGTQYLYYNGLKKDIINKMSLIRKRKREAMQPFDDLINTLKSWDE
tara:strand:+ start:678 stop:914 length:237 start_codon:yes stop_codon:yes gene_type:complete